MSRPQIVDNHYETHKNNELEAKSAHCLAQIDRLVVSKLQNPVNFTRLVELIQNELVVRQVESAEWIRYEQ